MSSPCTEHETTADEYIVCEMWSHYFCSNIESRTRWVLSKATGHLVACQIRTRHGWRNATRFEREDLRESLVEANEMLDKHDEYDASMMPALPAWVHAA